MNQMQKNLTSLGVLLAVAGGVGMWWTSQPTGPTSKTKAGAPSWTLQVTDATAVEVVKQGHLTRLEKSAAGWRIKKPVDASADDQVVQKLLGGISKVQAKHCFDDGQQAPPAGEIGLDVPDSSLSFEVPGQKKPVRLALGDNNAFDSTLYVERDDDDGRRVCTLPASVRDVHVKIATDFLDKSVLGTRVPYISSLQVLPQHTADGAMHVHLTRRPQQTGDVTFAFDVKVPVQGRADGNVVRALFAALGSANVDVVGYNVEGTNKADFGLDAPRLKVLYTVQEPGHAAPQPKELRFSTPRTSKDRSFEYVYVERTDEPWIGVVHAEMVSRLLLPLGTPLLSKLLLDVDASKVARMSMRHNGVAIVVDKQSGTFGKDAVWQMQKPKVAKVPAHRMTQLLFGLAGMMGEARVAPGRGETAEAHLARRGLTSDNASVVVLSDNAGNVLGELRMAFGKERSYANVKGSDLVLQIAQSREAIMPPDADDLLRP